MNERQEVEHSLVALEFKDDTEYAQLAEVVQLVLVRELLQLFLVILVFHHVVLHEQKTS